MSKHIRKLTSVSQKSFIEPGMWAFNILYKVYGKSFTTLLSCLFNRHCKYINSKFCWWNSLWQFLLMICEELDILKVTCFKWLENLIACSKCIFIQRLFLKYMQKLTSGICWSGWEWPRLVFSACVCWLGSVCDLHILEISHLITALIKLISTCMQFCEGSSLDHMFSFFIN